MGRGQGGGGGGARMAGGGTVRAGGGAGGAMSDAERASIHNYSNISYDSINRQLREGDEIHAGLQEVLDRIDSGLDKLPDRRGTTYRVLSFNSKEEAAAFARQFEVGKDTTFREYLSTSKIRSAPSFEYDDHTLSTNVRLKIKGRTGKDITTIANQPDQQEVLFRRGTKFRVTSFKKHQGTVGGRFGEKVFYQTDITLEEI